MMNVPTVREVWRLALPPATRVIAGEEALTNRVTWVATMHVTPPMFGRLEGGELAFVPPETLAALGKQWQLSRIIAELAHAEVAGVVITGAVASGAVKAAAQEQMPLLVLPQRAKLRDVEQSVVRLIVDRQAQITRRGEEIYGHLAQLHLENRGLTAIAEDLAQLIAAPIVVQDERLAIRARVGWDADESSPHFVDWDVDSQAAEDAKIIIQTDPSTNYTRYVAPIVIEKRMSGYVSTFVPSKVTDNGTTALLKLALERGAQVCALEFARERAVTIAADQWRGQFLDLLLDGVPDKAAIEHRANTLHYSLTGAQLAVLFGTMDTVPTARSWISQFTHAFRAEAQGLGWQVLLCPYTLAGTSQEYPGEYKQVVALCALPDATQVSKIRQMLTATLTREWLTTPPSSWGSAWGQAGEGITGLRASFTQAEQALTIGQRLLPDEHYFYFGDLGLYRLLIGLRDSPELLPFLAETLGTLEEYDAQHGSELVQTLAAFLEHHGNVSQTAAALHLHRNSLIYRLTRIAELTARDLDSADVRLTLHLALKLRQIIGE